MHQICSTLIHNLLFNIPWHGFTFMKVSFILLLSSKEDVSISRVLLLSSRYSPPCLLLGFNPLVAVNEGDLTFLEALVRVRINSFKDLVVGGHLCSNTSDGSSTTLPCSCSLQPKRSPDSFISLLCYYFLGATQSFPKAVLLIGGPLNLSWQRFLLYLLALLNLLQFSWMRIVVAMKVPPCGGQGSIHASFLFFSCLKHAIHSWISFFQFFFIVLNFISA